MNSTIFPDLESDTDTETDTSSILSNTTWEILGVATEYQIEESLDNYEDLIDFYLSDDDDDDDVEDDKEKESFQQDYSTKPLNTNRNVQTTTATQDDYNRTSSSSVSDCKELLISDRNKRQRTEINSNHLEFPDFTEIQENNITTTDINKQVSNHKYVQDLHVVVTDTKIEDWITFASNIIYKK